ncbi:MAG: beta strand repeat-containing protein, partial [Pirellula sp.]
TKAVTGVAAGTVASASGSIGVAVNGSYGSITIANNGDYTYNVDNSNAAVQALRLSDQTIQDVFTYTMRDAAGLTSTTQITVNIQGANDAPVATVDRYTAAEDRTLTSDVTQWANSVIAYSSQYSASGWSAAQVLGAPNVALPSDNGLAWAPQPANGSTEFITVGFATGVNATGFSIRESLSMGCVSKVELLDSTGVYNTVFNSTSDGPDGGNPTSPAVYDFTRTFSATSYLAVGMRVTVNTNNSSDWEELDAIGLLSDGGVLANDTDVDSGGTLTAALVTSTANGTLNFTSDGRFTYTANANFNGTDSFVYRTSDGTLNSSDTTVTLTVNAANDTPTAVADTATAVEAGGTANGTAGNNPTGNVLTNDTDVDSGDTKAVTGVAAGTLASASGSIGVAVNGSYGSITIANNGDYTYTVDNSNAAVQALRLSGQTIQDVFTYTMRDAAGLTSTTQLTVTIEGRNDNPIITIESGDSAAESINETNGTLATSGTLTVTDVDTTNTVSAIVSSVVASGTTSGLQSNNTALLAMFTSTSNVLDNTEVTDKLTWAFNSGSEHFNYLATGESLVLTYTITVTDSQSTTDTQTVVVTIHGTNDTPTITVVDVNGAVTEDATTPNLTDSGSVTFAEVDDTDILTSSVALSNTSTTGPTIPSGLATALSGAVSLAQTGTNDGTIAWNFSLANSLTQYLAAGETVTATYTITVTDDSGTANNSATRDVTVVITGTNDVPTITVVDVNGTVTEDAATPTLTDSGSITFLEVDDTDILTSSVALSNTSTTGPTIPSGLATALSNALSLTQTGTNDGTIAWNFSLANSLTQYLAAGETVTATYTITVTDDSGTANNTVTRDVTVVITGTNDVPTITVVDVNGAVTEDAATPNLTDSGSITFAEVDDTDVLTSSVAL